MKITDLNPADLRCLYIIDFFMKKYNLSAEQSSGFAGCMAYMTDGTFGLSDNENRFGIFKWQGEILSRLSVPDKNFNSLPLSDQLDIFCKELDIEGNITIKELQNINDTRSSAIIIYYTEFYPDRNKFYTAMKNPKDIKDNIMLNVIEWSNGAYSLFFQCRKLNIDITYGDDTTYITDKIQKGTGNGTYEGILTEDEFYKKTLADTDIPIDTDISVKYDNLSDIVFYNSDGTIGVNPYV